MLESCANRAGGEHQENQEEDELPPSTPGFPVASPRLCRPARPVGPGPEGAIGWSEWVLGGFCPLDRAKSRIVDLCRGRGGMRTLHRLLNLLRLLPEFRDHRL